MDDAPRQIEIARCLFREANDALFVFDPADLRVVDVNPAALRLTGLDRREALSLRLTDLIAADDPADLDRLVEANRQTTFFHSREGYTLARPGLGGGAARMPVNLSVSRVHVEPTPLGLAVVRDVSERVRAQQVLDRFFRLSPALFAVFDDRGRFVRANPAWGAVLGHAPGELIGRLAIDLVHPDDLAASLATAGAIAGRGLADFENRWRHRDGSYRRLSWNAAGDGGLTYAVAQDVTGRERARELERAKEAAEAADRAKGRFLAVLSHELRTPLNPILLAVTAMIEGATRPEDYPPALEMIRRNVEVEARLIDDLLDVTRIVQGKLTLHDHGVDAHALLGQAVETSRGGIAAKGLRLEVDLAARGSRVRADAARLQQVFWNLLSNALKFTPEGGWIAVRTRDEPDGWLVVEVADGGVGIDPTALPGIFDPFDQGEAGTTRRFGGLGLGLAICRGIVEAHRGRIEAASAGRGLGATFRVRLRAEAGAAPALPPEAPRRDRPGALAVPDRPGARTILLIEDEPATLRVMDELLRALGHRVLPAASLAEALRLAASHDFGLIISDLGLPDGSILDVLPELRARRPVPAIAVSGFGMAEDIRQSLQAGFADHLTKPIGLKDLEAAIRRATA